jgi:hypothetical protein
MNEPLDKNAIDFLSSIRKSILILEKIFSQNCLNLEDIMTIDNRIHYIKEKIKDVENEMKRIRNEALI